MLILVLWSCTSITPAVKADNIALAPVIRNAVGEEAASSSHGSWLNMQNLNQTPPQTYWIRVCILTRSQGVYLHNVKHEKYCSRLLISPPSETLWRSLTPKKNFPFGIEYMIFANTLWFFSLFYLKVWDFIGNFLGIIT